MIAVSGWRNLSAIYDSKPIKRTTMKKDITDCAPFQYGWKKLYRSLTQDRGQRLCKQISAIALFAHLLQAPLAWAANEPLDSQLDEYKPILLAGEALPEALGKQLHDISLQAVVDGEMEAIPFQIDEYNTGGAVYFKALGVPIDGTEGVMDVNDKLLFLMKDAGDRRTGDQLSDGRMLAEIELEDTYGNLRYVYLVEGSRLRSEEQYVRYSTDVGQVETDFYSLVYNRENQLNWDDFSYGAFKGELPLDTMKIRMTGGLLTDLTSITLNNKNFIATPIGEHVGPIRTTSQMKVMIWLFNLPIMDVSYQAHHYPKSMLYDVRIVMPEVRRKILSDPKLSISLDANNLIGSTVKTAIGPIEPAAVDGRLSSNEKGMLNTPLEPDRNWIWLSSHRDMDVLAFFDYLGNTREPLSIVYDDNADVSDPPERFKGALPQAGYRIDRIPASGFFGFIVSVYLSEGYEGDPEKFTEAARSIPAIRVLDMR
ncbi:hypothetical protein HDN1F_37830 [gamma proteobacterium HdN1]|nr:hypothetical protein HDN1F_37830 [gamma proteobacterium HdN1]